MQNHVRISSSPKGTSRADPDGEWPSLEYANWLLDQRFGARKRPYMAHFVKTYSTPLLQEVANIWGNELTEVSSCLASRFVLLINIIQVSCSTI
jgi:hypothetical protein